MTILKMCGVDRIVFFNAEIDSQGWRQLGINQKPEHAYAALRGVKERVLAKAEA